MSIVPANVSKLLKEVEHLFSEASIPSPHLDAEVLLAYILDVNRAWLAAHSKEELGSEEVRKLESLVQRRLRREPIAYLTGTKEFYGRDFIVTPEVLIPRPETEALIELSMKVLKYEVRSMKYGKITKLVDVGCGSGCIGITLKLEHPELDVTLCDISPEALAIAAENAKILNADVTLVESDLLSSFFLLPSKIQNPKSKIHFDLIVANLPYVNRAWETSPETAHEPALALYANDNGLELIMKLIEQSTRVLAPNGLLALEADPEQHERIIEYAASLGFKHKVTDGYALILERKA